jgi:hypothetical protein
LSQLLPTRPNGRAGCHIHCRGQSDAPKAVKSHHHDNEKAGSGYSRTKKSLQEKEEATFVTIELIHNLASILLVSLISALITSRCHQLHILRSFEMKLDLVPFGVDPEAISVPEPDRTSAVEPFSPCLGVRCEEAGQTSNLRLYHMTWIGPFPLLILAQWRLVDSALFIVNCLLPVKPVVMCQTGQNDNSVHALLKPSTTYNAPRRARRRSQRTGERSSAPVSGCFGMLDRAIFLSGVGLWNRNFGPSLMSSG